MAQGRTHSPEVTARVVAGLLLGRDSQKEIAQQNGISQGGVTGIKQRYLEDFERLKKQTPQAELIAPLVTNLLTQSLVTLTVQMELFGDKDWLREQSAGDLAVLHGVISDKTFRMLAALQRGAEQVPPPGE